MLKFILFMSSLTFLSSNWYLLTSLTLLLSFLWMLSTTQHFFISLLSTCLASDNLSFSMIILSLWISILMLMASRNIYKENQAASLFSTTSTILCLILMISFSAWDFLLFFIAFESSIIPTIIMIIGWGYQPERIQAGVYMILYTLFGSLPLLVSILSLYFSTGSLTFGTISPMDIKISFSSSLWYLASIIGFFIKLPMFLFHLWLPKAHVEAPVAGSMILAAILLKLGGYGLLRMLPIFSKINKHSTWVWISIGLIGSSLVSILCLRQTDMKSLIAYSSVAHMGLILCGLITLSSWSFSGSITLMVGHGLCSAGLFFLANLVYNHTASRSLLINKGLMSIMPLLSLWWFLFSIGNMAAPPSLNLLGEINLLISVMSWSNFSLSGLGFMSFFSAAFSIFLYSSSQHGTSFNSLFASNSNKTQEFLTLFLHWTPFNMLILKSSLFN